VALARRTRMLPRPGTPALVPNVCGFCIICAALTLVLAARFPVAWLPSEAPSQSTETLCVDEHAPIPRGRRFAGAAAAAWMVFLSKCREWQEPRSEALGWLPLMCSARSAFADTLARLMRLCVWFGGGCLGIRACACTAPDARFTVWSRS
jgi:hypothetical protein